MLQPAEELECRHQSHDPWNYEKSSDDRLRRNILLSELPVRDYDRVLDIGCGQGFITRDLPGKRIIGTDISQLAIEKAKQHECERLHFTQSSLFELAQTVTGKQDLVVITGVLYPQYVGASLSLVYRIIDGLLAEGGILASVHIDSWYRARFPYLMLKEHFYSYRDYTHRLEIYVK